MNVGGERFELDLLRVLDEVRIGQIPRLGNQQVFVRVNQKVKGTRRLGERGRGGKRRRRRMRMRRRRRRRRRVWRNRKGEIGRGGRG